MEHDRAAGDVGGFDDTGFGDDGFDDDCALHVGGEGDGWVEGLDGGEELAGGDSLRDVEACAGTGGSGDDVGACVARGR